MTTTPERQPLSLSDCDDVLAYIPHALGFHPQKSMVLLLIVGQRLEATLRVDLPSEIHEVDRRPWVAQVLGLLRRLPQVRSVVAVVYAPGDIKIAEQIPYQQMIGELEEAFDPHGIQLRQAWCLCREKVWDYDDGDVGVTFPRPDIALGETNLSLVLAGSAPLDRPWDGTGIATWANAAEVQELTGAFGDDLLDSLDEWAEVLNLSDDEALERIHSSSLSSARMLAGLRIRLVRDVLPFLAGVGTAQTMEMTKQLCVGNGGEQVKPLADFLLGRGWQSPDWKRLERLWLVSRDLLGVAVDGERHALMCILAWIEWARGRGTMAIALIDRVLSERGDYRLAQLLRELMNRGSMPEWATDELRAWRAQLG
ncbi:hypothetical protein CIK76_11145 [Glutamicibacter sp. BW80]|uniref:DUF4192 domain-containing protein n=1 Tax=unclassified Glutamicibacter TaxID=2627139 RepID=UPI000BB8C170|nr:DUF4192 domain-containing protein [Glutamicibacter sp. BW80]PCC28542.1 hypothetical protein CIK76_11145 [Glutamicibacter sp. BW80]